MGIEWTLLGRLGSFQGSEIRDLVCSGDGRLMAAGDGRGCLEVYQVDPPRKLYSLQLQELDHHISLLWLSQDGTTLIVVTSVSLIIFNTGNPKPSLVLREDPQQRGLPAPWASGGTSWWHRFGKPPAQPRALFSGIAGNVLISPDGLHLVYLAQRTYMTFEITRVVFDLVRLRVVHEEGAGWLDKMAFSQNGRLFRINPLTGYSVPDMQVAYSNPDRRSNLEIDSIHFTRDGTHALLGCVYESHSEESSNNVEIHYLELESGHREIWRDRWGHLTLCPSGRRFLMDRVLLSPLLAEEGPAFPEDATLFPPGVSGVYTRKLFSSAGHFIRSRGEYLEVWQAPSWPPK